jgi:dipeptidyl aminopeptidase/acylaminoacyl peptidase
MKVIYSLTLIFLITISISAQTPPKRKLRPSDIYRMKDLSDAQISPEGKWVVYVLSRVDSVKDKNISNLWMTSWDATQTLQLTSSDEGESKPEWSPDGKYISFLSSRYDSKHNQVWLMDRRGGEGKRITTVKGEIQEYKWSPDGTRIVLAITDTLNYDTSKEKNPKPHVIDRVHFKQDMEGFLDRRHTHLYLLTIETKKLDTLTRGDYDEKSPAWSPDGK